jgi:hypothetical protein
MRRRSFLATAGVGIAGVVGLLSSPRPTRAGETVRFEEMYKASGILGLEMSEKLVALNGKPVDVSGFMAPPLKAEASFFVLTREPVSLCPFCNSDADWPSDIIVVYLRDGIRYTQTNQAITVSGTLEIGSKLDAKTGFVSLVRLVHADYRSIA